MPGINASASATLVVGNLQTSSAVITSTMALAVRLTSMDRARLARMPTTDTCPRVTLVGAFVLELLCWSPEAAWPLLVSCATGCGAGEPGVAACPTPAIPNRSEEHTSELQS